MRRIHDPERPYAKWGGHALTALLLLIVAASAFDLPNRIRPFHRILKEEPLMWAAFGSWAMLIPAIVGIVLTVVYHYLPVGFSKKRLVFIFGAAMVSVFGLTVMFSGSRAEAVYSDRTVHRGESRNAPLKVSYFKDLERLEIGCSTFRRRYGVTSHTLIYRLVFRDGHSLNVAEGWWNAYRVSRLEIIHRIHRQALGNDVPVHVARKFGDGAPFDNPNCINHVLNDLDAGERAIVSDFFNAMPST